MLTSTVNPYTFIPVAKRDMPWSSMPTLKREGELLTGVIHCKLVTLTQIAIPESAEVLDEAGDSYYPFFRMNGSITIPGSSLRGVIRSVYEAMTNSCMKVFDERFHARSKYKKPGLLGHDSEGYFLYHAVRYRAKEETADGKLRPMREAFPVGARCSFDCRGKAKDSSGSPIARNVRLDNHGKGFYLKPNTMTNFRTKEKSSPSVFVQADDSRRIPIAMEFIDCLKENVSLYDLDGVGKHKAAGRAYEIALEKLIADTTGSFRLPVWYLDANEVYEFAPSQISRSVYSKTPKKFLEDANLSPCVDPEHCCPACDLFGFVQGNACKASRVRFGDASLKEIPPAGTSIVRLPALMGPRVSSIEFYLRCDGADGRSYNQYTPNDDGVMISGRKMYWHHNQREDVSLEDADPTITKGGERLNFKYELVPAGSRFKFDVFFDGVRKDELAKLVYALTLGSFWDDAGDRRFAHKIGHGKPIGLGSSLVEVEGICIRNYDATAAAYCINDDYANVLHASGKPKLDDPRAVEIIEQVTDFDNRQLSGKKIEYPRSDGEIFKWFADNRKTFDKNGEGSIRFIEVLARDGKPGYESDFAREPSQKISFGAEEPNNAMANSFAFASKQKISFKKPKKNTWPSYELAVQYGGTIKVKCPHCGSEGAVSLADYERYIANDPTGETWKCSKCR